MTFLCIQKSVEREREGGGEEKEHSTNRLKNKLISQMCVHVSKKTTLHRYTSITIKEGNIRE